MSKLTKSKNKTLEWVSHKSNRFACLEECVCYTNYDSFLFRIIKRSHRPEYELLLGITYWCSSDEGTGWEEEKSIHFFSSDSLEECKARAQQVRDLME